MNSEKDDQFARAADLIMGTGTKAHEAGSDESSLAEAKAVFELIRSQDFLSLVIKSDPRGRDIVEVQIGKGLIEDKPKCTLEETVVFCAGRQSQSLSVRRREYSSELKGKIKVKEDLGEVAGELGVKVPQGEGAVRRWFMEHYNESWSVKDVERVHGNIWIAYLSRTLSSPEDLVRAHRGLLSSMYHKLGTLV